MEDEPETDAEKFERLMVEAYDALSEASCMEGPDIHFDDVARARRALQALDKYS